MTNAAPNAARLARLAGVPCPTVARDRFAFLVWDDGPNWGHIDVTRHRVTRWNPVAQQHDQIFPR
jgi:hypothetical protein